MLVQIFEGMLVIVLVGKLKFDRLVAGHGGLQKDASKVLHSVANHPSAIDRQGLGSVRQADKMAALHLSGILLLHTTAPG